MLYFAQHVVLKNKRKNNVYMYAGIFLHGASLTPNSRLSMCVHVILLHNPDKTFPEMRIRTISNAQPPLMCSSAQSQTILSISVASNGLGRLSCETFVFMTFYRKNWLHGS